MKNHDPDTIALAALQLFAAEPERLAAFLALTGLTPQTLRQATREPGFAAAVLDHVIGDDDLVRAVAAAAEVPPEAVAAAHAALNRLPGD